MRDSHSHRSARPSVTAPTVEVGSSKRRVLIAETDAVALRICRDVVEKAGFAVEAVASGIAAVIAARQERPELILIAPELRDAPGREVVGWLRANAALLATPIIMLPAPVTSDAVQRSVDRLLTPGNEG
jgi:DNA-binding response OmpR family regulator